eukprot:scaffold825_cov196-Alexandrium_tamarense.AAC.40
MAVNVRLKLLTKCFNDNIVSMVFFCCLVICLFAWLDFVSSRQLKRFKEVIVELKRACVLPLATRRNDDINSDKQPQLSQPYNMKRTSSESSFVSVPEDGPVKDYRDYRVRKSSLIA